MAIIKCSECGHSVSDTAITCPRCGAQFAISVVRMPPWLASIRGAINSAVWLLIIAYIVINVVAAVVLLG